MTTKAEMLQRVGEELGLVPVGQSIEAQDVIRIGAAYDEVYERLKDKGLATWAFSADVPTALTPYMALIMEEKLLTAYSLSDARYQRIKLDAGENGDKAMKDFARVALKFHESTTENCDF